MAHVDIYATYGALLLGSLVAVSLSGFVLVQSIVYMKVYSTDAFGSKMQVLAIWLLDLLHTIFVCIGIWHYVIARFGDSTAIESIHWSIAMTIVVTAILTLIVHVFFAHRIFKLSGKNWFLTIPILVLAIFRLTCACSTTGEMLRLQTFAAFKAQYTWLFTLGLALSSAVDVLITACLCILLQTNRGAGPSSLNELVDSLILYTFENGSVTCIGTVLSMIFWLTMSDNLIFMALHFAITKLYANSFLVTLNMRYRLRYHQTRSDGAGMPVVLFANQTSRNMRGRSANASLSAPQITSGDDLNEMQTASKMQINVQKSVEVLGDDDYYTHHHMTASEHYNAV